MPDQPPCDCCPNTFSTKDAESDLKRYLEKGPDRTTRELVQAIVARGIHGATVLDVGGGIGAVQLELLAAGAARAESVDATEAYVEVARTAAERRGFADRTTGRVGDFVALAPAVEPADVVALDRVVCCYPDMPALLGAAADHARRILGLVYPRDAWWNRVAARLIGAWGWLTRDSTRWYLHDDREIDRVLGSAGFSRHEIARDLIWQVVVYERSSAAGQEKGEGLREGPVHKSEIRGARRLLPLRLAAGIAVWRGRTGRGITFRGGPRSAGAYRVSRSPRSPWPLRDSLCASRFWSWALDRPTSSTSLNRPCASRRV